MFIHYEVHIWYFSLEHISEQQKLVEHINVVDRPCYSKKSMQNPQVMRANYLEHDGRGNNALHCKLSFPLNGTDHPLLMHVNYIPYHIRKSPLP
jgi:hypothetical protein